MKGLVAYTDDSGNESESTAHDTAPPSANKTTAKAGARRIAHVIRRPPTNHRNQTRAHISTDTDGTSSQNHDLTHDNDASTSASPMDISNDEKAEEDEDDELAKLRKVLQPPPIPGLQDWGIPPASNDPVDPEIASKLTHFLTLKHTPQHPKHFNDSLMSSRSFRNPHLYANLVDWADVSDEKVSNFPVSVWDALGELEEGWFAENITEAQRRRADKIAASQGGKRSLIAFTNNSTSAPSSTSLSTIANRGVGAPGIAFGASTGGRERFQPYGQIGGGVAGGGVGGGASGGTKPTRWG